ncbi:MAG TPA: glycosyltransferase, partial [Candidatus Paceibacterota bacterium]
MISVCITTYNGEKHIQAQLDSILPQLCSTDEIIISDDGSTDRTIQIVEKYEDKRIKIYHHTKYNKFCKFPFSKITKNMENALIHAKGDYIFL